MTTQDDDQALVAAVTATVRQADAEFQKSGGSSHHWVRDHFLPHLNRSGMRVVRVSADADTEAALALIDRRLRDWWHRDNPAPSRGDLRAVLAAFDVIKKAVGE